MDDELMIISSRQTSDYLPYPFLKRKRRISLVRHALARLLYAFFYYTSKEE